MQIVLPSRLLSRAVATQNYAGCAHCSTVWNGMSSRLANPDATLLVNHANENVTRRQALS